MKKIIILSSLVLSFISIGVLAADAPAIPKPSKEMREKMAVTHEKMAACLRSEKPIKDCHKEMRKQCEETMGKDGCPMMGKMGMGKMHKHDDGDDSKK